MNPREVAGAFWFIVFVAVAMRSATVRLAVFGAARLLLNRKILAVNMTGLLWAAPVVGAGIMLGLLGSHNAFAAVAWLLVVPLSMVMGILRSDNRIGVLRQAVMRSVSLTAIIEFFASNWTFPLAVEMLLVPLATIVVATLTVAQAQEQHRDVARVLTWMVVALGTIIMLNAGTAFVRGASLSAIADILKNLAAPVWLLVGFTPWVALVAVYSDYDQALIRLRLHGVTARDARVCIARVVTILGARHQLVSQWRDAITTERVRSPRQAIDLARALRDGR